MPPPPDLKPPSFIVLALVAQLEEATPYELKARAGEFIGRVWSIAHSQLYSEPERLTGLGLLSESREEGGRRRKRYRLTDEGRQAYDAWLAEPATDTLELRDPGLLKLALGADRERLAEKQAQLHQRTLDEYLAREASLPPEARHSDAAAVLAAGIGHEREYVRFWTKLLDASRSGAAPDAT